MTSQMLTLKMLQLLSQYIDNLCALKVCHTYLYSSCGESESCLGWVSVHLSSPSVEDCPSEPGVSPNERRTGW